jgi:hypothetical protein
MIDYFFLITKLFVREKKFVEILFALYLLLFFYWFGPNIFRQFGLFKSFQSFILILVLSIDYLLNLFSFFSKEKFFLRIQPVNFKTFLVAKEIFWIILIPIQVFIFSFIFQFSNIQFEKVLKLLIVLPVIFSLGVVYSAFFLNWDSKTVKGISFLLIMSILGGTVFLTATHVWLSLYGIISLSLNIWTIFRAEQMFNLNSLEKLP